MGHNTKQQTRISLHIRNILSTAQYSDFYAENSIYSIVSTLLWNVWKINATIHDTLLSFTIFFMFNNLSAL